MTSQESAHADEDSNERISRFVEEYLIDSNATKAYIRAFGDTIEIDGKSCPRSYHGAAVCGARMLKNVDVQQELKAARKWMRRAYQADHKRIALELGFIAFSDIGELFDDGDRARPIASLHPQVRKAIE